ncbi:hypothetical protein SNEBB_008118 [Seison nebaliae]|nr:hypothetical protein SNEBB_008118 [Seison nebaliae]
MMKEEVLNVDGNKKIFVEKIVVNGVKQTNDKYITDQHYEKLLKSKNLEDCLHHASNFRQRLLRMGSFNDCSIVIDKGNREDNGINIIFFSKEPKRFSGDIHTTVGENEVSLKSGLRFPNLTGNGDIISEEITYSQKRNFSCQLFYQRPFVHTEKFYYFSSIFHRSINNHLSSYLGKNSGMSFGIRFPFINKFSSWTNEFEINLSHRNISTPSLVTPFYIRLESGNFFNTSLQYRIERDERNHHIFPDYGSKQKFEFNCNYVDHLINHLKFQLLQQQSFSLLRNNLNFSYTIRPTIVFPVNGRHISICDRLFLGGATSIRGFKHNCIGDSIEKNPIGATGILEGGMSLFSHLPFLSEETWPRLYEMVRVHSFVNGGTILQRRGREKTDQYLEKKLSPLCQLRLSCGFGIALNFLNVARVELNYCFPIKFDKHDQLNRGFQFGIGLNLI